MATMREAMEAQRRAVALFPTTAEVAERLDRFGRCGWMLRDAVWRVERCAQREEAVMATNATAVLGALEDATQAAEELRARLDEAANAAADAGRIRMAAELDRLLDAAEDVVSRVTAQRGVARYG